MCFWSVSEAFLAWGQLSEVTAALLTFSPLFTSLTPHTLFALFHSSPYTVHLALSSPHSLSCCHLVLAPACLRACALSLARAHCRSLSVNHSLLCHKDNSFWHFRVFVCVCVGVAFFRIVLKMSQSLFFLCIRASLARNSRCFS